MATKEASQQKNPVLFLLTLLMLEAGVVFLAVPKDSLTASRVREQRMVVSHLGAEAESQVKAMADGWYRFSFIRTGFLQASYDIFINRYEGREGDLPLDDRGLGKLVDQRLDVFWQALHLAYYRFALLMAWLPYLLPLLLVASVDGLLQREIRKWQFAFSSPAAHRTATRMIFFALCVAILSPFFPFPLPPFAMPVLMGITAVALWVSMANIQKRI